MNITKNSKSHQEISPKSKSFLVISSNYQIDALYHILIKNPSLVNTKDQKGETFLSYAIKRKNIEIAELILTSPILDYKFQDQNGNSYLHLAVINQLENIIKILIKKGIDVNMQNNDGNTALHFAYSTGDIKFITMIIESKIDFSIKNKNGLIAEEILPGTFPEILDISNNNNLSNNINVTHNKNNTVTINLNVDENNNNKENEKDNNEVIINDRGQVNKSIKINWEENGINNNINNDNNNNINNDINNNINNDNNNNINNDINNNINNDNNNNINNDINNNINQLENTSKTKLKYSLVNFSYSDEGEEEEENGIINNKLSTKQRDNENKHNIKSSDIFDLASSLSYQEKVANVSSINAHVVGEPNILINKESSELGINDEFVNINKIKTSKNNPTPSLNNNPYNNLVNNGINMSQASFHTEYENGRKINLSEIDYNHGNRNKIKSTDFKNNNDNNMKGNGQNIDFNYSSSIDKERGIYNNNINNDDNDILNKQDSGGICNYKNNNFNQSNTYKDQPDINQDFTFSPFTTLKKPLNKQDNGSEINNNSKMNNNSKNVSINNEINSQNKNISKNNFNINNNSQNLKHSNVQCNNSLINSNLNINNNISNDNKNNNIKNNYSIDSSNITNNINTNLSQISQNNRDSKNNSKIDFNTPTNISKETLDISTTKISRDSLYIFLAEIRMENYYNIMNSNGFDDIQLLINQAKNGIIIKDKQLKEAGIKKPGDRAKILIRLQEKAGNFIFPVPKEVYHVCQNSNIKEDININKLNEWLKSLKIENYLELFVKNGYHSIELMLLQMESKNPLTDEILKEEIGITKIGHRSRIINKLIEEGKSLYNKLKTSMLVVGNIMSDKICDCTIY